ncbi:MAG: hypothetical protein JWP84_878 [Tardiphaga sp.]|nr:hypothetical protein [Tardiphaga sp.]
MNTRTGSSSNVTATRHQRSSRKAPHNLIGVAAVALVALGCGWTLYANLFAADVAAVTASVRAKSIAADLGDAQSSFAERFDTASFADRFGPFVTAATAPAAAPERQIAWFDPTYSLGAPPERFVRRTPPAQQAAAVPTPQEVVSPPPTVKQLVASIPLPSQRPSELRVAPTPAASGHEVMVQRARATVLAAGAARNPSMFEKLFGKSSPAAGTQLAFAGADGGITSDGQDAVAKAPSYDRQTAVYDISAKKVYMPDGSRLEAHSGLGSRLDDPAGVREKMRGATPPHVYDLTPREALFHGVPALRLTPVGGEGAIYGRTGLLAHTYMLGPNGDSNGCVSFRDYNKFLQAYRNGEVKRLVVVATLD